VLYYYIILLYTYIYIYILLYYIYYILYIIILYTILFLLFCSLLYLSYSSSSLPVLYSQLLPPPILLSSIIHLFYFLILSSSSNPYNLPFFPTYVLICLIYFLSSHFSPKYSSNHLTSSSISSCSFGGYPVLGLVLDRYCEIYLNPVRVGVSG
jgi:hypothetical protein